MTLIVPGKAAVAPVAVMSLKGVEIELGRMPKMEKALMLTFPPRKSSELALILLSSFNPSFVTLRREK
jgi:hypothetical protein